MQIYDMAAHYCVIVLEKPAVHSGTLTKVIGPFDSIGQAQLYAEFLPDDWQGAIETLSKPKALS